MVPAMTLAAPRSQIDSKKELEKLLKATCEVFIMAVTKLTVEPMLSFITKVTAVRVASSLNPGKRLREQVHPWWPPFTDAKGDATGLQSAEHDTALS